jgi:hypothetical protein
LSREGLYLGDGLYADMNFGSYESPRRVMARLDTDGAPSHVAHFLAAVEGKAEPQRGRPAAPNPADALATVWASADGVLEARLRETPKAKVPRGANSGLKSEKGLLGFSQDGFAVALGNAALPKGYAPIGTILAATNGLDGPGALDAGTPLRTLRIYRVGERAKAFKTVGYKKTGSAAGEPSGAQPHLTPSGAQPHLAPRGK